MEFLDIIHNTEKDPFSFNPDVFIAASGYESRSTVVPKKIADYKCRKIAYTFTEYSKELYRPQNDKFFESSGYEMIPCSGFNAPDFSKVFEKKISGEIKVMIDISVMTRKWYHSLLQYIGNLTNNTHINLRVVYCPAKLDRAAKLRKSLSIKYLNTTSNPREGEDNEKPLALVLGLGPEKDIAQRTYDYFRPEKTKLLHADSFLEKEYVEKVYISNHNLINKIDIKNLKGYDFNDTAMIYRMLIDLVLPLRRDYRIVIVPQGPKMFSLITMILQLSYPDIELAFPVYKYRQIRDRKSYSEITFLDLHFGKE